jgi:hypothetical protein
VWDCLFCFPAPPYHRARGKEEPAVKHVKLLLRIVLDSWVQMLRWTRDLPTFIGSECCMTEGLKHDLRSETHEKSHCNILVLETRVVCKIIDGGQTKFRNWTLEELMLPSLAGEGINCARHKVHPYSTVYIHSTVYALHYLMQHGKTLNQRRHLPCPGSLAENSCSFWWNF